MKTATKEEALKRIETAGLEDEVREVMELNLDVIFGGGEDKAPRRMDIETKLGTMTAYEDRIPGHEGIYVAFTPAGSSEEIDLVQAEIPRSGKMVRLGMYGDPYFEGTTAEKTIPYKEIAKALNLADNSGDKARPVQGEEGMHYYELTMWCSDPQYFKSKSADPDMDKVVDWFIDDADDPYDEEDYKDLRELAPEEMYEALSTTSEYELREAEKYGDWTDAVAELSIEEAE